MSRHRTLIAVLISAACTAATAGTVADPRLAKPDVCGSFKIIHINGIMTDQTEAGKNLQELQLRYGNAYAGHLLTYKLAYNQSRGFPTDFYQSVLQVIKGYYGATWSNFYNAVQSAIYAAGMSQATAKTISKTVDDLYGLTKPAPYQDADLNDIVTAIQAVTQWSPGVRIVIVPHSQGNLYANLVVPKLVALGVPLTSIGVVGVAVPYSSVPTGNTYVTSANDLVIDSVRAALANIPAAAPILAANVTVPYNSADLLGHDFIVTYFADPNARSKIIAAITSEFGTLKTTRTNPESYYPQFVFTGVSQWADCTGTPPQWHPPTAPSAICWYTWWEPIVSSAPAGNYVYTWRPGAPSETTALATAQANGCVALAKSVWPAAVLNNVASATVSGNCSYAGYSDNDAFFAARYNGLYSGDGVKTTVISSKDTYFAQGGTIAHILPTCRN